MRNRFVFGTQVCSSLAEGGGADREWLISDGTGGYASGTGAGLRTRRQHALLVTAEQKVALVTLDPVVTLTSLARAELGVHEWASRAVAPQGHRLLESFDLTDGVPRWRWRGGGRGVRRQPALGPRRAGGRRGKPASEVEAHVAWAGDGHIGAGFAGPAGAAADVVASYPGGRPVARDTLTGYEGLFLETGRADEGRALLRGYADRLGVPAMDVPLWYLHAVERHVTRTGDTDLAAELLPGLDRIIAARPDGP